MLFSEVIKAAQLLKLCGQTYRCKENRKMVDKEKKKQILHHLRET